MKPHDPKPSCLGKECPECWPPPQHTPAPWNIKIQKDYTCIDGANGEPIFCLDVSRQAQIDAAYIVKAVNAYQLLLDALKDIVGDKRTPPVYDQGAVSSFFHAIRLRAQDALAKAEGK